MSFFSNLFKKKTPAEIDYDRRMRMYKKAWKQREEKLKDCETKYLQTNPKIIVIKREYKQDWLKKLFLYLCYCIDDNDYERFERILRHAVQAGFSINDPIIEHFGLQEGRHTLLYYLLERSSYYSKEKIEKYYLVCVKEGETEKYPGNYSLPDLPEEWPFKTDPHYLNLLIELGANLNRIYDQDLVKHCITAVGRATAYGYPEWFIQTLRNHGGRSWREITQGMPPEMIDEFFQRLAEENRRQRSTEFYQKASRRMP